MFATNALTGANPATFVSSITLVPFIGMTYPAFTESQNKPQELRQLRSQIPKRILSQICLSRVISGSGHGKT